MHTLSRNYIAAFIWVFTACYCTAVGIVVYLVLRDGPAEGDSLLKTWSIVAAFVGGCGLLIWLSCSRPCVKVSVTGQGTLRVAVVYPHRWVFKEFPLRQAQPAVLIETVDSDGDPYFLAQLSIGYPLSEPVRIAEGRREHCEAVIKRFNALR